MKESDLRKTHRWLGIILAVFIILQAGSGLWISIEEMKVPHSHAHDDVLAEEEHHGEEESLLETLFSFIHHGGGTVGVIYRVLLGIGILGMAISGSMIHFKIKARTQKRVIMK